MKIEKIKINYNELEVLIIEPENKKVSLNKLLVYELNEIYVLRVPQEMTKDKIEEFIINYEEGN